MKQKRNLIFGIVLAMLAGGYSLTLAEGHGGMKTMQEPAAADASADRHDVIYTCACGDGCGCNSVSTKPGNCKCGKPMGWGHMVKVEGDEALVCTCAEGCTCKQDAADPTKCGCGKTLKRVSLKDTGVYFCNCGGSCKCNTASDKPEDCKCGMPLKQH